MVQFADYLRVALLPNWGQALQLAFQLVRNHERFHFRFDVYALHEELTRETPLYNRYHDEVYQSILCSSECSEEALANRSALEHTDWTRWPEGARDAIEDLFLQSPPGYRDFRRPVAELQASLGGQLASTDASEQMPQPQALWVGNAGPFRSIPCPEHILVAGDAGSGAQLRLKGRNRVWDFHKGDADRWPSWPHGHDLNTGHKLSLSDGRIYDPRTRQAVDREPIKRVIEIRGDIERRWPGMALDPLQSAASL